jgi:hypothetical protein
MSGTRTGQLHPPTNQPFLTRLPSSADLELYTIWTDGWQLITLALMLLIFSNVVPLPAALTGNRTNSSTSQTAAKPYAKLAIMATIFHHVTTGYGAYTHWVRDSHHTKAMDIGVYGNVALTALGLVALRWGMGDEAGSKKRK